MSDFKFLKRLYDEDNFQELLQHSNGNKFLKILSIKRAKILKEFAEQNSITIPDIPHTQLLEFMFNEKIEEKTIEKFIQKLYKKEREERKENEDNLYSQLYKLQIFDWGGLFQNNLEQTINNNYVRKIQNFATLEKKIENEIHASMRGYVLSSWYNHWTTILIEDIFKDNNRILPAIGLVKKVDFFWDDFPFDLKVTHFPEGFMKKKRKELNLRPELTELKDFARKNSIHFDKDAKDKEIFNEIITRIKESSTNNTKEFLENFMKIRRKIIQETTKNPKDLLIWLYEEQGERRFDASNRLFLILVDLNNLEESWKLKRNKEILKGKIDEFLDNGITKQENLKLEFKWKDKIYTTYSTVLFIFVN